MDPFSALSVASNIIDLTFKAAQVVKTVVEVYKSVDGLSDNTEIINRETDGLKDIVSELRRCQSQAPYCAADQDMRRISDTLISQCGELQSAVETCRSSQKWGFLSAANASLRMLRKKGEIEQLQKHIASSRDELFRWVDMSTNTRVNLILTELKAVSNTNCEIQTTLNIVNAQLGAAQGVMNGPMGNGTTACIQEIQQLVTDRIILQLLDSPNFNDRFEDVVTQEEGTFEWIFTKPELALEKEPNLTTTFPDWLESGDGIFHICGKPGSGKSTLMKYICRNRATGDLLAKWSGDNELLIARFFFWRMGTDEQKSMRGLIRSLLHQVLGRVPKLSRVIFSREIRQRLVDGLQKNFSAGLDSDEIIAAFSRLVEVPASSQPGQALGGIRICLFVDGLDEFDNTKVTQSYRDLVSRLCNWTTNSDGRVKICVSSRAEAPFMEMLDESKRFTLQNLTWEDINLYIGRSIERNLKFQTRQRKWPEEYNKLVNDIINSANGVFLWVALVLKGLENGLDDDMPIQSLRKIISGAPGDLNDLLDRIMSGIHEASRGGVEVFLSTLISATTTVWPNNIKNAKYLLEKKVERNRDIHISAMGAFFVLRATDMGISMRKDFTLDTFRVKEEDWFHSGMSDHEFMTSIENMIRTRCKGLVEITGTIHIAKDIVAETTRVKFMHRSVPEFLQSYFARDPASELNDLRRGMTTIAWTYLVDVKFDKERAPGSTFASFIAGELASKRSLPGSKMSFIPFREFAAALRELKLGDEWADLFRTVAFIQTVWKKNEVDRVDIIEACAATGLHELIDWLLRETDVLADDIDKSNVMYLAICHSNRFHVLEMTKSCFAHGMKACIMAPKSPYAFGPSLRAKPIWHLCQEEFMSFPRQSDIDYEWVGWDIREIWLKHGADPRIRFSLSDDGHCFTGVSGLDNSGIVYLKAGLGVPPALINKRKGALSLRDLVLYVKPHNEAILLELLKDDTEDDIGGVQGPGKAESG
ncbi:putative P-loop containing nucleoside triphosphate hydrolase [Rosellinia necatrix]|uniref:Putative P-loop containing nucleoside triphosphate hydrolase n=1 Tax=Rosellinia necatrix TaxID=77044 RepID=A0A1W2TG86_ROSNE|nr:putative P-loop containing nucleoside triphosphate hydrolase [Rosellinia necatrix]